MSVISMTDMVNLFKTAYETYKADIDKDNSRYKSWEHCYYQFQQSNSDNQEKRDFLALHLAFYLASWGMYRGSSFLLQKDYKVHCVVVDKILKYSSPSNVNDWLYSDQNSASFENLCNEITDIYSECRDSVGENNMDGDISDTLLTKVLLGTIGCVPAYDRFFKCGIKLINLIDTDDEISEKRLSQTFNFDNLDKTKRTLAALSNFFDNHKNEIVIDSSFIEGDKELEYPEMKYIDMILWQLGYIFDIYERKKQKGKSSTKKVTESELSELEEFEEKTGIVFENIVQRRNASR